MSSAVERAVRAITRDERVAYLRAHGWRRTSAAGVQSWRSPDPDDPAICYSLAAAIRTAIAADPELHREGARMSDTFCGQPLMNRSLEV